MCQLIFVNTKESFIKRILTLNLMIQDSLVNNKDGCGIFSKTLGIFKCDKQASLLTDLGEIIKEYTDEESPAFAHVRAASLVAAVKVVKTEFSHPFESNHYILAHNGTLSREKSVLVENKIDSQLFLEDLETHHKDNLVKALQDTMSGYTGKFAFLIYEKKTGKYFAARGSSATLFTSELSIKDLKIGYVINTEEEGLSWGLVRTKNIFNVMGYDLRYTKPEKLPECKIFELGDSIKEIGDIKENRKVEPAVIIGGVSVNENHFLRNTTTIINFCEEVHISIRTLDEICYIIFNKGLISLSKEDINTLINKVIPYLRSRFEPRSFVIWDKLMKQTGLNNQRLILERGLQFPYFFNDYKILKRLEDDLNK